MHVHVNLQVCLQCYSCEHVWWSARVEQQFFADNWSFCVVEHFYITNITSPALLQLSSSIASYYYHQVIHICYKVRILFVPA